MAKNIYICYRDSAPISAKRKLLDVSKEIFPDNIEYNTPLIYSEEKIIYGVFNPTQTIETKGESLVMGGIFSNQEAWYIPLTEFPDGSFALFRSNNEYCEVVTDVVASRTIWYYFDESVFIASTSQRAIVLFLGDFQFNNRVLPWMLSSGSLGPDFSWDKRIKRLNADASVILNRNEWSLTDKQNKIEFKSSKQSKHAHKKRLEDSLKYAFKNYTLDSSKWVLPLSGGYDSRGILCLLKKHNSLNSGLRTITWGLEAAQYEKGNDAYVAVQLAKNFKTIHKYYNTDLSQENVIKIFDRFINNGEGRVDHIAGYMDGFSLWKTLYEDGVQGVLRGDEGFGIKRVSSPLTIRTSVGSMLCTDYSNLKDYMKYGISEQVFPERLRQREEESLSMWRDRLYHSFRIPTILAALSDLKLSYVELLNPLLSKNILLEIRQLPDNLRTSKALFKKIVNSISPRIPYATKDATAPRGEILKEKKVVEILKVTLQSERAKDLFHSKLLETVILGMKVNVDMSHNSRKISLVDLAKRVVPRFIKNIINDNKSLSVLDNNILAFRIYVAIKTVELFNKGLHEIPEKEIK